MSVVPILQRMLPPGGRGARRLAATALTATHWGVVRVVARRASFGWRLPSDRAAWLAQTIEAEGYCLVPDYFGRDDCARAIDEFESAVQRYPTYVHHGADHRLFGLEHVSTTARRLADDPELLAVAARVWGEPETGSFVLGARLDTPDPHLGSGEGWHRDSFEPQIKAILYLTDVEEGTGPLQLVRDSQRGSRVLTDGLRARLGYCQTRISDEEVDRLLVHDPGRLVTLTAPAGTLLLVNTSAIHRGAPLRAGVRYALTDYYFPTSAIARGRRDHFAPYLASP